MKTKHSLGIIKNGFQTDKKSKEGFAQAWSVPNMLNRYQVR